MTEIPDDIQAAAEKLLDELTKIGGLQTAHIITPSYNGSFSWDRLAASGAIARALMAERERCAARVEKKAVHLGRQECCGFGVGSPPECCADPVFMISNVEAAFAIRGGTNDR